MYFDLITEQINDDDDDDDDISVEYYSLGLKSLP